MTTQRSVHLTLRSLAAVGCLLTVAPAARGAGFEGVVRQVSLSMPVTALKPVVEKIEPALVFEISDEQLAALVQAPGSGAQVRSMDIKIKGTKVRADLKINDKDGYLLVDTTTDTAFLVVPADKAYLQMTRADREAAAKSAAPGKPAEKPAGPGPTAAPSAAPSAPQMRNLESFAIVNDEPSHYYELVDGPSVSRAWLTEKEPDVLAAFRAATKSTQAPGAPPSAIARFAEVGLPMRVQTLNGDRYEQMELAEIRAEPVPDELMQVPKGFTKLDPNSTPAATPAPTKAATP
jgi:hypothetical protein